MGTLQRWPAPVGAIVIRATILLVVSIFSAVLLRKPTFGDAGGFVAFCILTAASWYCGPALAAAGPLVVLHIDRYQRLGDAAFSTAYTTQEIVSLLFAALVMTTIGWAGKLTRKSIGDLRQREKLLQEQAKQKDQFLATLAHELRNPLAPLRYGVDLLPHCAGPKYNAELFAETHRVMTRQLEHMVRLIDDLLDISRVNTGKIQLRRELVNLVELMEDAVQFVRPHVESAEHTLEVTIPDGPCALDVDRARAVQVLSNLLNNAAKFTPPGGRIEFEARHDGEFVVIRVADTGIGISPESLTHVFDLFSQVDARLTRKHGGLGIGLNLSRRLVEMHGGTITAASEGVGKGSVFVVRFPVVAASGK